jgi:hypothetical protein
MTSSHDRPRCTPPRELDTLLCVGETVGRRAFIARSAIGAGVVAAGTATASGCVAPQLRATLAPAEAEALAERLANGLRVARETSPSAPWQVTDGLADEVFRLTVEALVVADVARSIPENAVVPEVLAAPLARAMPLVDRAVLVHHGALSRLPPATRHRTEQRLRAEPELGMNIAEWLDGRAAALGVAAENRLALRRAATNMTTRIRRQSASAVFDDTLRKSERLIAPARASLGPSQLAATDGIVAALWAQTADTVRPAASASARDHDGAFLPGSASDPTDGRWSTTWARPGDEEIQIGAIMMPFGLISCGLLLIAGLCVLIAGVVQNAEWDGSTRRDAR